MFYYLKGILTYKKENFIVIDCGGIGYKVFVPTSLKTGDIGKEVKVYTYIYRKEDITDIYGFHSEDELNIFEIMISVSGVGPKAGLSILSTMESSKFALAVATNDAKTITKVPGIGPKLAQRIILELKDKMKKSDLVNHSNSDNITLLNDTSTESVDALMVLGYSRDEAKKAVNAVNSSSMDIESIIKEALKILMK